MCTHDAGGPFASAFAAATETGAEGESLADFDGRIQFSGGASTVDLRVLWSEPVHGCDGSDKAVTPRRIEIDVDGRRDWDFALDGYAAPHSDIEFVADNNAQPPLQADTAVCDTTATNGGTGTLVARVQSTELAHLPNTRSVATIRSGTATDLAGNPSVHQSPVHLTPSPG